jgi:UDP-N-acetylglucosamine/UDP-N-acetylgalactosamine diphosphorylase
MLFDIFYFYYAQSDMNAVNSLLNLPFFSGNKVVEKFTPNEAVGVVCRVDGKFQVVEYSEIGTVNAELTRPSGQLVYYAGNICNHFFTTAFLRKVSDKFDHLLPHHVAKKKIPCIEQPKPTANNGIKLEKFVFDVFQFSESFVVSIYLKFAKFYITL